MKESRILGQRISVILTATKATVRNFRGTDEGKQNSRPKNFSYLDCYKSYSKEFSRNR